MIALPETAGSIPPTPRDELDRALATLSERAAAWTATSLERRIQLLRTLADDTLAAAPAWCLRGSEVKGLRRDSPLMAEDWLTGPYLVVRYLTLLERTLADIQRTGRPQPPALGVGADGRVEATVFPPSRSDQLFYPGFSAEVRFLPGLGLEEATERMGRIYRPGYEAKPGVALVLGAGNASVIGPTDVVHQLFSLDRVVVLKMHPANDHLGPHIAEAFQALIREGFLRIVYGDADVGSYLVDHDGVDTIHLTGSDKTRDTILYGGGDEGARRKAERQPRTTKEVTAELGNVTPVIVVPGPWSPSDIAFQGDNIASMLTNNGGFNCITGRMIIQHRGWAKRLPLLNAVRESLRRAEPREPHYPGARQRWQHFIDRHPSAEWYGERQDDRLPFALLPDLDPDATDDLAYRTESFCGIFGEVGLEAARSVSDYLDRAVEFCNETLWGTLGAAIIVHPGSLRDPEIAAAVDRAVDRLRYGTVTLNHFPGVAFGFMSSPWGGYPDPDPDACDSGVGFVHNTYLLEGIEKTVVRGPFRPPFKPVWFHTNRHAHRLAPLITRYTVTGEPKLLPAIMWHAARG